MTLPAALPVPDNAAHDVPRSDPCVMVIFGATGDLAQRKLLPALYNLAHAGLLAREFAVLGTARSPIDDAEFRTRMRAAVAEFSGQHLDEALWQWLEPRLFYMSGDATRREFVDELGARLHQIDREHGTRGNYLYYLATAPSLFAPVVQAIGRAGLADESQGGWRRVVIEKPFGHDLESARVLNRDLTAVLQERQIYRIDHYLGKETVQNLMVFRFGNGIFEPIWNRRYIDHIQITAAETVGVEQRGGYYEEAGALRDMVPNHLFQLVTLTALEPPVSFDADAVRDEQAKILQAIQPFTPEDVLTRSVRGQYAEGRAEGGQSPAYRNEPGVDPQSTRETFVAMKLLIDNWRWADVPFYLRTGKRLPRRVTEISIQFKRAPFVLFRHTPVDRLTTNRLIIRIQPDEGITLRFGAKIPGPHVHVGAVNMEFCYRDYFHARPSTGYERLLYDCMIGDATLFQRADMVEAAWAVVAPVLDVWQALPPRDFPNYAAGTWGPQKADELLARDGRRWREIGEEGCVDDDPGTDDQRHA